MENNSIKKLTPSHCPGGPDAYPKLQPGLVFNGQSTECCLKGPLVQDMSYVKSGITMMICPVCHVSYRTLQGCDGLRCIWKAPPQMIAHVLGEDALTPKEKLEYEKIKGTWLENLRLMPVE